MTEARVMLVGGAPGVGKSTLGRALAVRLGRTCLSTDDVHAAVKAVTTPESHPGIHVMSGMLTALYFTGTEPGQLIADAEIQHAAVWPAVERLIRNHATWGAPIVIEGWHMHPDRVAALSLDKRVASVWLVIDPDVLEARELANHDFFSESPDAPRMGRNFLARSLWFNDLVETQAAAHGMRILRQDGSVSVETLCARACEAGSA